MLEFFWFVHKRINQKTKEDEEDDMNTNGKFIIVSLEDQKVYAFCDKKIDFELECLANDIPLGKAGIRKKLRSNNVLSELIGREVFFILSLLVLVRERKQIKSVFFYQDHFISDDHRADIKLREGDAKRLFEWARVGTPVIIQKESLGEYRP